MANVKVLIVEDHLMVRMGLSLVLEKIGDIDLIGEAEDWLEGVEKTRALLPDVVLMDIGLPTIDGPDALNNLKRRCPNIGKKIEEVEAKYEDERIASLSMIEFIKEII